jgi:hypothetical protein
MQLLIRRGQQQAGVFGNKISFSMTIRVQYTEQERALINKYNMGGSIIYDSKAAQGYLDQAGTSQSTLRTIGFLALSKMNLSISLATLQKGHQIQCADLGELLECEDAIVAACKNVKNILEVAETFDGREILVDLDAQVAH